MESYFNLVDSWVPDWRLNAKKIYGFRGVVSNPRASNTCLLLHWGGEWPGEQCAIGLALYQFCEFSRERTPGLWKASELAFEQKTKHWLWNTESSNSNHITHGMMNQGQCAARLGRSDVVYDVLERMTTRRYVFPSFMISYWPGLNGFGFDPVGTIPDVLNNSLIFACNDTVDLLPALPEEWPQGSITGVLLRGQIKVEELKWDIPGGKLNLSLTSGKKQTVTLQLPPGVRIQAARIGGQEATNTDHAARPNVTRLPLPGSGIVQVELAFAPADFSAIWDAMSVATGKSH